MATHPLLQTPPIDGVYMPKRQIDGLHLGQVQAGKIAVLSQSKAILGGLVQSADRLGLAVSWLVHVSPDRNASLPELVEALAFDGGTRAVLIYLDDLPPARVFLSNLRLLARLKPVVILKASEARQPN